MSGKIIKLARSRFSAKDLKADREESEELMGRLEAVFRYLDQKGAVPYQTPGAARSHEAKVKFLQALITLAAVNRQVDALLRLHHINPQNPALHRLLDKEIHSLSPLQAGKR